MDIAITGHSKGIGKAMYDYLSKSNNCKGFDIITGYDINVNSKEILEESRHCSVFINNAYCNDAQVKLLEKWHKLHFYLPHFIINISSIAADLLYDENIKETSSVFDKLKNIRYSVYSNNKFKLNLLSHKINRSDSMCKSSVIMPSGVSTDFASSHNHKILDKEMLEPLDIAVVVEQIIKFKTDKRFISSIAVEMA